MIIFNTLEILILGVSKINYFRFSTKNNKSQPHLRLIAMQNDWNHTPKHVKLAYKMNEIESSFKAFRCTFSHNFCALSNALSVMIWRSREYNTTENDRKFTCNHLRLWTEWLFYLYRKDQWLKLTFHTQWLKQKHKMILSI